MKVQYEETQCIFCLNEFANSDGKQASDEHLIPASLGGILTSRFACKGCNESLGASIEARAKSDPAIRHAIFELRDELPLLFDKIEDRQEYTTQTDAGKATAWWSKGQLKQSSQRLPDGSLLVPEEECEKHLRTILAQDGLTDGEITQKLHDYWKTEEETHLQLSSKTSVIRRKAHLVGQDYKNSHPINPMVLLKIAYEFGVLLAGRPMLARDEPLDEIRSTILKNTAPASNFVVTPLIVRKYRPIHGILFEGNEPYATFQVRLFGKLAYRVQFLRVAIEQRPIIYTHDLVSNKDDVAFADV